MKNVQDSKKALLEAMQENSQLAYDEGVVSTLKTIIPLLEANAKNINILLNNNQRLIDNANATLTATNLKMTSKESN